MTTRDRGRENRRLLAGLTRLLQPRLARWAGVGVLIISAALAEEKGEAAVDPNAAGLEPVFEMREGIVSANEFARTNEPFPFNYAAFYKVGVRGAIDVCTFGEDGSLVHRFNPLLKDTVSLFPSYTGEYVVGWGGVPNFDPPNIEATRKKVYSREGDVVYEGRLGGFPRLIGNGNLLAVFFISQKGPPRVESFGGRNPVVVVDVETGEHTGIDTSVAYAHGVSENSEGDLIIIPEYGGYWEGSSGGTKVYDAKGNLKFRLHEDFLCSGIGCNTRGKIIYASDEHIVQAGYAVKERKPITDEYEGTEATFFSAERGDSNEREYGVQVYDGHGKLLWEEFIGTGQADLQIIVSPNEEYLAVYSGPDNAIDVYSLENGELYWRFAGPTKGLYFKGTLSNDGRKVAVSTFNYVSRNAEAYVIGERGIICHLSVPSTEGYRGEGVLDASGEYLLVSNKADITVYRVLGNE